MSLQVSERQLQEVREMIASGDVNLAEARQKYRNLRGKDTSLNDEQLIAAVACLSDDDDEELANHIDTIETGGYTTHPGNPPTSAA